MRTNLLSAGYVHPTRWTLGRKLVAAVALPVVLAVMAWRWLRDSGVGEFLMGCLLGALAVWTVMHLDWVIAMVGGK